MKTSTAVFPEEYPDVLVRDGIGENDSYSCGATYKGYLKFYIDTVKGMDAHPVPITAPARQFFESGRLVAIPGHHGGTDRFGAVPYVRAVRQPSAMTRIFKQLRLHELYHIHIIYTIIKPEISSH